MPYPAGVAPSTGVDGDLTASGQSLGAAGGVGNYRTVVVPGGQTLTLASGYTLKANRLQQDAGGVIQVAGNLAPDASASGGEGTDPGDNRAFGAGGGGGGYALGGGAGANGLMTKGDTVPGGAAGASRTGPLASALINDAITSLMGGSPGGAGSRGMGNQLAYGAGANGYWEGIGGTLNGTYDFEYFIVTAGTQQVASETWIRARRYIEVRPGGVLQTQNPGPGVGTGSGANGGGAAWQAAGGGGGGGAGHGGAGVSAGAAGSATGVRWNGSNAGGGGAAGPTYDNLTAAPDGNAPWPGLRGSDGGAGGAGNTSPIYLSDNAHGGDTTAGQNWDFNNAHYRYTSLYIPAGVVCYFTGVAEISVQGDCWIEGQLIGTGRGFGGGAGAPQGSNFGVRGANGGGHAPGQGGASYNESNGAPAGGGGGGHGGAGGAGAQGGGQGYNVPAGTGGGTWNSPGGWPLYAGSGGGGGGAERANDNTWQYKGGDGGAGGASLTIRCNRFIGSGQIVTDGTAGQAGTTNGSNSSSAGGGGGAGGHVRIEANHMQCAVGVYARGGAGGACGAPVGYGSSSAGGGGGGAGGHVYVYYASNNGFCGIDCSPGGGGATYTGNGVNNGGTGSAGGGGQSSSGAFGLPAVGGGAAGRGGGVLKLTAPRVIINGTVQARSTAGGAGAASGWAGGGGGGGGSGGTIWTQSEPSIAATGIDGAGAGGGAGGAATDPGGAGGTGQNGRWRHDARALQASTPGAAGVGGGVAKIVAGVAILNGTLRALGGNGGAGATVEQHHSGGGGGGSGGALWLVTGDLRGSGSVLALGGTPGTSAYAAGGAGGAGRVRLDVPSVANFGGTITPSPLVKPAALPVGPLSF